MKTLFYKLLLLITMCSIFQNCTEKEPVPTPVAEFDYDPLTTSFTAPTTIKFSNFSTNADIYYWTYPGGNSTDKDLILTFPSAGSYRISLKVTGSSGTDTKEKTYTIVSSGSNNTTTASFTFTPNQNLVAPAKITFTNTSKNADTYIWDFGDGTTSTNINPVKEFSKPGTFKVKLTASSKTTSSQSTADLLINNTTTKNPTVTDPGLLFLSSSNKSFAKYGDWAIQEFTITKTSNFVFRFASQYQSQAAIITDANLNNFKNMNGFQGFGIFDNKFGNLFVTLAAGKYYVAVRNTNSGSNITSFELDYDIILPPTDRCDFYDYYLNRVESYGGGNKMWDKFTIQNGFRYFMDGCNTGFETDIIPESQLENFKNGRSFTKYADYNATNGSGPGFYEVKLPPGIYYFIAANKTNATQSIVYIMERWQLY